MEAGLGGAAAAAGLGGGGYGGWAAATGLGKEEGGMKGYNGKKISGL